MAAHFQAVDVLAHVVRVVDHVAREPQHLALELAENAKLVAGDVRLHAAHGCLNAAWPIVHDVDRNKNGRDKPGHFTSLREASGYCAACAFAAAMSASVRNDITVTLRVR